MNTPKARRTTIFDQVAEHRYIATTAEFIGGAWLRIYVLHDDDTYTVTAERLTPTTVAGPTGSPVTLYHPSGSTVLHTETAPTYSEKKLHALHKEYAGRVADPDLIEWAGRGGDGGRKSEKKKGS